MADNDVASVEKKAVDDLSPGVALKKARNSQDKSLEAISKELHLDRWMLEALERDDYSALGAPVFAKGHLRQYAKLLGIEPDDLMVGYYQVCGSREQPPLVADSMLQAQNHNERTWGWVVPVLIAIALIGAIGGIIYWYMQPTEQPASVGASSDDLNFSASAALAATNVETPEPVEAPAVDAPPARNGPAANADSLLIPPELAEPVEVRQEEGSGAVAVATDNLSVTLRFTDNSWVEVYDAKRQKLLYGLVESAAVKYLNGPPPINVFLGRQSAVDVEVNGEAYAIPVTAMRGNTARFQIEQAQ